MSDGAAVHDYVIVGAGSAGCVLANRLSADEGTDVLLLEAGNPDDKEAIDVPAMFPTLMHGEEDWDYHTVPQPELNDRELYHPRGRTLGGSSSLNAMVYIRGHPSDYDHWAALGNDGWEYDEMLRYFKRAEHFEPGADDCHGEGGPLTVAEPFDPHPTSEAILEAAVESGIERNADFNGARQAGAGLYHVTQKDGQRCSTAAAYLRPVLDRPNLTVETDAQVTRIRFDGDRAVGVTYEQDGAQREVDAAAEVVLSAGAINSPQLLLCSGVGPADHLAEHDIDVVADLPGVGRNLQDHQKVFAVYERTAGPDDPTPESNVIEAGVFARTDPDLAEPDVQSHCAPVYVLRHGLSPPEDGRQFFSMSTTQLRPESRGEVRLASADPFDDPIIDPNYLDEPADLETLVEGLRLVRRIAGAGALSDHRGEEVWPGEDVQMDAALRAYVREHATTVYHPVGTCKMGHDAMAVVDDGLRVHGVDGLRVVDASVMPEIVGGNTNAPTIAIAEKAADLIA